jgi:tRNA(Ile)-lysidine synthase
VSEGTLEARFAARMGQLLGPDFPDEIVLAVSGGGDSMAMLALSHGWARVMGVRLRVVTVDHGLRAESAAEAGMVATECAALGHPHEILRWQWDGGGNLQDAARQARVRLIGERLGAARHVLMAHTRDDVAETVLMRLGRGSGVEGLSGIAERRNTAHGFEIIRPLLRESRSELRHYLSVLQVPFVDDPSNDDARFDRVKARQALAQLGDLGVTVDGLAQTAARMRRARVALEARAVQVAARIVREAEAHGQPTGDLLFDRDAFAKVEEDTQLRLLAAALQWVSSNLYRPRVTPLDALRDRILVGGGGTLHGCEIRVERDRFRVFREYDALKAAAHPVAEGAVFDRRWIVAKGSFSMGTIRALGEDGWAQIPEKPDDTPPFHAARSLPALFEKDRLVACPWLKFGPSLELSLCASGGSFIRFLESD